VIEGMELLTALPRGGGDGLGMYTAEQRIPIASIRLASDLPEAQRPRMEVLRTDTATWRAWIDARSHRTRDGWFVNDAGYADLCNIRVPVREAH
jgi:peptidylprolyl isomerase